MQTDRIQPVPDRDVQAVRAAVEPAVREMMDLQLLCGLRPAELCGLKASDLDTTGPVWTYRPPQNRQHVVHLGPVAGDILRHRLERVSEDGAPLFMPLAQYTEAVRVGCLTAGVPAFDPNRLRLTAAYHMALRCGLEEAEAVLAHGEPSTTCPQWQWRP
jgi:integrase